MPKPPPTAIPLDFQLANDRVRLRAFVPADAAAVFKACGERQIRRFTTFPEAGHMGETRAWIENQESLRQRGKAIDFGILPVGGLVTVGAIGLSEFDFAEHRAEIGYWVAARARRRGYATAAVALLTEWSFGPPLQLDRVDLRTDIDDLASRRVAEHVGFEFEGVLRSFMYAKERRWDIAQYAKLAPHARAAEPSKAAASRPPQPDTPDAAARETPPDARQPHAEPSAPGEPEPPAPGPRPTRTDTLVGPARPSP